MAIKEHLVQLLNTQLKDHGIVLWYDPHQFYAGFVQTLNLVKTEILHFNGSFFALRQAAESYLNQPEPPHLLIYLPLEQTDTRHALVELEAAGVVLRPGAQPPERNTRPAFIARHALEHLISAERLAAIEQEVEAGKWALEDLEKLAEEGASFDLVGLVFGVKTPLDIVLSFLTDAKHDIELQNRQAEPELTRLLQALCDIQANPSEPLDTLRQSLARFILTTDLVASLPGTLPEALANLTIAQRPGARQACQEIARAWRLRRDFSDTFATQALSVDTLLKLSQLAFTQGQLQVNQTFLSLEQALQCEVTQQLLVGANRNLIDAARVRQSSFWSERLPAVQAEWALIAATGRVLLEAQRIETALQSQVGKMDAAGLLHAYAQEDQPWCLLDTAHRHMERRIHNFDFDPSGQHDTLEQLIAQARDQYMQTGSRLAEHFTRTYSGKNFSLPGVMRQHEIFEKCVKSHLGKGKIAYIWVDALRFEMARELAEQLGEDFGIELQPVLGAVPTITEIGMASLLPFTLEKPGLIQVADSKLAIKIGERIIKDRKDRLDYLSSQIYHKVFDARLDDLLPSPKKAVKEGIKAADLIVVTSQEIDSLCEGDNVPLARRTMDDMLHELRRVFRILAEMDVKTIICVADHGYLFGDELGSDMKIEAPGGTTADLHRRVWVGQGGSADPAVLRTNLSSLGWDSELELATPWNFACFKVKGGAKAYFHGGLSLPELVIPVLTLHTKKKATAGVGNFITWKLIPSSPKITTRFFSVQVQGAASGLFEFTPPRVRVEIRSGSEVLSTPVSASYGFSEATSDVQLRALENDPRTVEPDTITLMIAKEPPAKKTSVSIHVFDVSNGIELLSPALQVELNFAI